MRVRTWFFYITASVFALLILFDAARINEFTAYPVLLSSFEVGPRDLEYDFDKDGEVESVRIERNGGANRLTIWSKGRSILEIPYSRQDGTYRTHLAFRDGRVLVFDGQKYPITSVVYAWDGQNLKPANPDHHEEALLLAMAAVDDGGQFRTWSLYFIARPVVAMILLVTLVVAGGRRTLRSPAEKHV